MAKSAKLVYNVPEGPPKVVRVKIRGTKHIQRKKTGRMDGRKSVDNGEVFTRSRVEEPFILVKKSKTARGHTRVKRKEYLSGQFI